MNRWLGVLQLKDWKLKTLEKSTHLSKLPRWYRWPEKSKISNPKSKIQSHLLAKSCLRWPENHVIYTSKNFLPWHSICDAEPPGTWCFCGATWGFVALQATDTSPTYVNQPWLVCILISWYPKTMGGGVYWKHLENYGSPSTLHLSRLVVSLLSAPKKSGHSWCFAHHLRWLGGTSSSRDTSRVPDWQMWEMVEGCGIIYSGLWIYCPRWGGWMYPFRCH